MAQFADRDAVKLSLGFLGLPSYRSKFIATKCLGVRLIDCVVGPVSLFAGSGLVSSRPTEPGGAEEGLEYGG